ncbi:MAG TPA: polymorphic toxin-type HINT domain-containing protein [Nocardioides sp.]|nr:polymorphic toxin-type HINT domain-containing protein [Nocardioides sp.]
MPEVVVPALDIRVSMGAAANAFGGVWTDSLEVTELGSDLCGDELADCQLAVLTAPGQTPELIGKDRPGVVTFETSPMTAALQAAPPTRVDEQGVAQEQPATAEGPTETQSTSMTYAVAGSEGSYKANPLPVSAGWQVGVGSGEFSYSYDFELPDPQLTGAPSLGLAYSSGSVDAMTLNTNGQGSAEGLGWSMGHSFVTRSYASCGDDGENSGDLCWKTNGPHLVEDLRLVLNGQSSELIPINGQPNEFRLRIDPGWQVTRNTTGNPRPNNSDNDGESFTVRTPDGTTYRFGAATQSESVWTVPVFGNNSGEPCADGTFATSWCNQGWRWNLDEVTDRHGNRVIYDYAVETNHYKRGPAQVLTPYHRAGRLTRLRYAFDDGIARAEVLLDSVQRCAAARMDPSVNCPAPTADTAQAYPDVPTTLICGPDSPCANNSPTFFSTNRYNKVTTQVRPSGQGERVVDVYELNHDFPRATDGVEEPHLWLDSIRREGRNGQGAETMPKVEFNWVMDQNRVVVPDGQRSLHKPRIQAILTEYGGRIQVSYGQAGDNTPNVAGDDADPGNHRCTPNEVTGRDRWEMKQDCFAQRINGPSWEWFHKYLVRRVALSDRALGYDNPPHYPGNGAPEGPSVLGEWQVTDYHYLGAPAWRFSNNLNAGVDDETWDDWRGYETTKVTNLESDQRHLTGETLAEQRVTRFRGMHGSRLNLAGDPVVARLDSEEYTQAENEPLDQYWLAGRTAETQTLSGTRDFNTPVAGPDRASTPLETTYHEYGNFETASPASTGARSAHLVYPKLTRTHTRLIGTGTDRTRSQVYTVASSGTSNRGVTTGAITSTVDDGAGLAPVCTTATWKSSDELWLLVPGRTQVWDGACNTGTLTAQTDRLYDNEVAGTNPAVTIGNLVREDVKLNATETARHGYAYDSLGRIKHSTNARGHTSKTLYQTAGTMRDVVTELFETNALAHASTTTLDPGRGQAIKVLDPNGAITTMTHDGLGRLTTVRLPGNAGDPTPSMQMTYANLRDAQQNPIVPRVTTTIQRYDAKVDRVWQFYDAWGRSIETHVTQGDGKDSTGTATTTNPGRVVTVTGYDSLGRVRYSMPAVPNGVTPNADVEPLNPNPADVANVVETMYDGAGRVVRTKRTVPTGFSSHRTDYFGDRILTKPARGGWSRTEINGRGQTTRVAQFTSASEATLGQAARYAYTAAGQLKTIHSAVGSTTESAWTYTYDLAGRRTAATDPDTGTSTIRYDLNGNVIESTDAGGRTFATAYDFLDRPTQSTSGGNVLTEWGYDVGVANSIGRLVFTRTHTRADGTDRVFTRKVGGYDARGNAASTTIEYPNALLGITSPETGSTTTNHFYNHADMPVATSYTATANVPSMKLTHHYNPDAPLLDSTQIFGGRIIGQSSFANDNKLIATTAGLANVMAATTYGYEDATGRASRVKHATRWSTYDYRLSWDDTDNLTHTQLTATNTQAKPNTVQNEVQCNAYDGLNRLVAAWSRVPDANGTCSAPTPSSENLLLGEDLNYAYEGNRLTTESNKHWIAKYNRFGTTTRRWNYGRPGSPHAATDVTSQYNDGTFPTRPVVAAATLSYDAAGNITKSVRNGRPTIDYTYDPQGRIATMTSGTTTRSRAYDADGALLAEYGAGSTTLTLDDLTISVTPGTAPTAVRTFSHAGQAAASITGTAWTYLMADQQGSVRLTAAEDIPAGATRSPEVYSNYEPFGKRLGGTPAPGDRGYLNKRSLAGFDPNTIQLGHRIYSSDLNVFVNPDPVLVAYDPQNLNPYSYSRNNPTTLSDPSGLNVDDGEGSAGVSANIPDEDGITHEEEAQNTECYGDESCAIAYDPFPIANYSPTRDIGNYRDWAGGLASGAGSTFDFFASNANPVMTVATLSGAIDINVGSSASDSINDRLGTNRQSGLYLLGEWGGVPGVTGAVGALIKAGRILGKSRRLAGPCSFGGSTVVLMADGTKKAIEDVEVGDKVIATNPVTGVQKSKTVTHVWVHDDTVTDLLVDGEVITTTEDHPFWSVTDQEFERADQLSAGERVLSADGRTIEVSGLALATEREGLAYNLSVQGIHTYHVGAAEILVHNTNECGWPKPTDDNCLACAREIQDMIGGDIVPIRPAGGPRMGPSTNNPSGLWAEHYVVVRDGRVYDGFTGTSGMSIPDFKAQFKYADDINFGF